MKRILSQLEELWCMNMHNGVMWPVHGHYRCRICLREYPVRFEVPQSQHTPLPSGFLRDLRGSTRAQRPPTPEPYTA